MLQLYQFPISHYCEKARWALTYKKLNYKTCNLLPGPHVKQTMSIAATSEVPILQHGDKVIQCSGNIIDYLDSTFIEYPLTPSDEVLRQECLDWEAYIDKDIGVNLRTYFYHTLLQYPDLLIPLFTFKGPWYGRFLMKLMFPKIKKAMIRMMRINDKTALKAKQNLILAINKINSRLSQQPFLVGQQFTRADLAAAALLAPLVQPDKYGLPWPTPLPSPLQKTVDELSESLIWVNDLYDKYR